MVALEKERDQRIENCGIVLSLKEKPSQGNRLSLQAVPAKRENRGPYPILIVLSRKARRANLFWETAFSTGTNRGQFSECRVALLLPNFVLTPPESGQVAPANTYASD